MTAQQMEINKAALYIYNLQNPTANATSLPAGSNLTSQFVIDPKTGYVTLAAGAPQSYQAAANWANANPTQLNSINNTVQYEAGLIKAGGGTPSIPYLQTQFQSDGKGVVSLTPGADQSFMKGVNWANSPLGLGDAMNNILTKSNPLIFGQIFSMAFRLIALKAFHIGAMDGLSGGFGALGNFIGQYGVYKSGITPPPQNYSALYSLLQVSIALGMGALQNSVIGKYNAAEAQHNSSYSYNFSYEVAEFQAMTLAASSVLAVGVLAEFTPGGITWNKMGLGLFGSGQGAPSSSGSSSTLEPNGAILPGQSATSGASPSGLVEWGSNFGGTQQNILGSTENFVNRSDIQNQLSGITADWAVNSDNMWTQMKENNKPIYN